MNTFFCVKDLVSVIVPVYKVEPYIQECVRSIVNQSYPYIEIILVDDACEDRSIEFAREVLLQSDCNWRIISHESNKGVSVARNNGILNSKGEYLFFVDSDDFLAVNCIEKQVEVINKYGAEMIFANQYDIIDGVVTPSCRISDADTFSDNPIISHVRGKTTSMVWNRLIRKDFYARCGVSFVEGIRYEDELWSFSLIVRAKKIGFLNEYSYYYRRWSGAFTGNKRGELYRINCSYLNILHHYTEAEKFDLFSNAEFRMWLVRKTVNFLIALVNSNLKNNKKRDYLAKFFESIKLPQPEFDKYTLYVFQLFKKLPFANSLYCAVKLIYLLRRVKNNLSPKR